MDDSVDDSLQYVVFQVGPVRLGANIECIREICRSRDITPVYRADDYVRGVVNLRGRIVTVIDLRWRLGLGATPPSATNKNIIVEWDDEQIGLLVDDVDDIVSSSRDTIFPPPAHARESLARHLTGVCELDGELVGLLDLQRLLERTK